MTLVWEDRRRVAMDSTMLFGHGYNWDGWELLREEASTWAGRFAVWPNGDGTWAAYGGDDGWFAPALASEVEAKARVARWVEEAGQDPAPVDATPRRPEGAEARRAGSAVGEAEAPETSEDNHHG